MRRPSDASADSSASTDACWGRADVAATVGHGAGSLGGMPLAGVYVPSPSDWVREQVERYEGSGGTEGTMLSGRPVVIMTMRGAQSGNLRKVPVMRVEHEGTYAAVASKGGAPSNPTWYANLVSDPRVDLQDGPVIREMVAREVHGEERALWWDRAVAAYHEYADYQDKTDRLIPVFVLEPAPPDEAE